MLNNEEDKTAFMYARLAGSNCLLQWYAVSFLVLQHVLIVKSNYREEGGKSARCACMHIQPFLIDREIPID